MSPQILELLILAAIAFFVVNKLISILGTTDEGDPASRRSAYGERIVKDITPAATNEWTASPKIAEQDCLDEQSLAALANPKDEGLIADVMEVAQRINKFNAANFVTKAARAWQAIIEAIQSDNKATLETLADPRYLEKLLDKKAEYQTLKTNLLPEIKITRVTFFGNSVILTLQVKTDSDQEEWSFTRNPAHNDQTWFLSNID